MTTQQSGPRRRRRDRRGRVRPREGARRRPHRGPAANRGHHGSGPHRCAGRGHGAGRRARPPAGRPLRAALRVGPRPSLPRRRSLRGRGRPRAPRRRGAPCGGLRRPGVRRRRRDRPRADPGAPREGRRHPSRGRGCRRAGGRRAGRAGGSAGDAWPTPSLRAPFAGMVAARPAHVGDVVSPGTPLVEVEGGGGLELEATLEEGLAAAVSSRSRGHGAGGRTARAGARGHPLPVPRRGPGHAPVPGQGGPAAVARPALRPLRPPRAAGRGGARCGAARGAGERRLRPRRADGRLRGEGRHGAPALGGGRRDVGRAAPRSGPGSTPASASPPTPPACRTARRRRSRADAASASPVEIAHAFLDSKLTPLLIAASLGLGALALLATPREEEPQIRVPMVDVTVAWPGAEPAEVESPGGEPGRAGHVGHLRRRPRLLHRAPGFALVTVRFRVNEPNEASLVKVYERLSTVGAALPPDALPPAVELHSIDDVPFLTLTLWSEGGSSDALRPARGGAGPGAVRDPGDEQGAPHRRPAAGRARGARPRPDGRRRRELDRPPRRPAVGVACARAPAPPCATTARSRVEAGPLFRSAEEVERVVVGVRGGRPVYVADVARVVDGPARPPDAVFFSPGPPRPPPGGPRAASTRR